MDHYNDALQNRKGMKISIIIDGKEHAVEGHEPNHNPSGLMHEEGEDKEMDRQKLGLAPATKEAGSKDEGIKADEPMAPEEKPHDAPMVDGDHSEMEAHMMDGQSPDKITKEFHSKKPRSLGEHLKKDLAEKKMKK